MRPNLILLLVLLIASQLSAQNFNPINYSKLLDVKPKYKTLLEEEKSNQIGSRANASLILLNDKLYIFSGWGTSKVGGTSILNDFWVYDLKQKLYTCLSDTTSVVPNEKNKNNFYPGGRVESKFFKIGNQFGLIGGQSIINEKKYNEYNDYWLYDPLKNQWKLIEVKDGNLPLLSKVNSFIHDNQLIVLGYFSPYKKESKSYEMWSFNLKELNWRKLNFSIKNNTNLDYFKTTANYNIWTVGSNVYFYGGNLNEDHTGVQNLYKLNLDEATLECIMQEEGNLEKFYNREKPGYRTFSNSWVKNGNLFLFGGTSYDMNGKLGFVNDLWEFNLSKKTWTSHTPDKFQAIGEEADIKSEIKSVGSIALSSAVYHPDNNALYLFGGYAVKDAKRGLCNDLWKIELLDAVQENVAKSNAIVSTSKNTDTKSEVDQCAYQLLQNPVQDKILLLQNHTTVNNANYKVLDLNSNIKLKGTFSNSQKEFIDVSSLEDGYYVLEIEVEGSKCIFKIFKSNQTNN